ncbi:HEPN domain-containing protein [Streptomyces sp. NBC_01794]|uniref:ApeA N-terminal domain 1-containing protein n=1 Tax=Streptomyces sp. NBC_01794 TaxID=2975942 RepID=UPI00308FA565|nr:hypothetical protein OIE54_41070 [Streptomyces sp. NBC_01794]
MSETRSGVWWTPDAPAVRIPGSLIRTDTGWQLSLIGTLMVDIGGGDGLALVPPRTILGSCQGASYTLLGCYLDDWGGAAQSGRVAPAGTGSDDQNWMLWRVESLLQGAALSVDTRYTGASFRLTGLSAWWPPSGLRGPQVRPGRYQPPPDVTIQCQDGLTITIGVREHRHYGRRAKSLRERVSIFVSRESGFTIDELHTDVIIPLRILVAIGLNEPVQVYDIRLHPEGVEPTDGEQLPWLELPVQVDPADGDEPQEISQAAAHPLPLAPALKDMEPFIAAWMDVARQCAVSLDAIEPRQRSGSVQGQLLEVINAAETLHRTLHDEPTEFPFAERVRDTLQEVGGFTSSERRDVRDALKFAELTLEQRLLQLVEELGTEVSTWLFNGQATQWAFTAAAIRNVLSHGYEASHGVHEDPGALIGVLRFADVVVTLRILVQAGMPSGQDLVGRLQTHPRLRYLVRQSIADWPALASAISPHRWPQPGADGTPDKPE